MRTIFRLVVVILTVLFGIILFAIITYAFVSWYLNLRHLVDFNKPETIAQLLPLIPPAMAVVAAIITAGAGFLSVVVVAVFNSQHSNDLEEKKKQLS